jgi:hypothetical protein
MHDPLELLRTTRRFSDWCPASEAALTSAGVDPGGPRIDAMLDDAGL